MCNHQKIAVLNEKDHNIFRAQIEKLQCIAKHIPETCIETI